MKNEKGSVLVWAFVVIMIFSIFTAVALSISYSMVKRSVGTNTERQLYFTARSATVLVANKVISTDNTALLNQIVLQKPDVINSNNNFFPENKNMGDCIVKAKCNQSGDQIIVTAIASNEHSEKIVSAIIVKNETTNLWEIYSYDNKDINDSR